MANSAGRRGLARNPALQGTILTRESPVNPAATRFAAPAIRFGVDILRHPGEGRDDGEPGGGA